MVTLDNYLFFAWAGREMMYKCTYFDENFFPQMEYRLDRQKEIMHMKKLGKSKVYYTHQILNVAMTTEKKGQNSM